ncbi:Suppressor of Sensor Kinase (SLN1), partial [Coemansia spiralis]
MALAGVADGLSGEVFYLHGYSEDGPRRALVAALESVGARAIESVPEDGPPGYVVVPDDASDEHRATAQATGRPVVSEAVLRLLVTKQLAGSKHAAVGRAGADGGNGSSSETGDSDGDGLLRLDDDEYRERTEWHQMLTSALCSQVVDGEKKRLNAQADGRLFGPDRASTGNMAELPQSQEDTPRSRHAHLELWLGCRAAIRGRTPLREKKTLESLRA